MGNILLLAVKNGHGDWTYNPPATSGWKRTCTS